jgi:hypothetical protein
MSWSKMFSDLFINLGSNHNLRRRLYADLDGAPTRLQGAVAFVMFLLRAVTKTSPESASWAKSEKPLSETFAGAVVDD